MPYNQSENNSYPDLTGVQNALQYNATTGKPELRVNVGGGIEITGTVNIPGLVTVNSTPADPVHIHVTEVGTSGILSTPYMPVGGTVTIQDGGNIITVDGSVNIGTMPEVEIKNDSGNPISISKNTTVNSDTNPIFVKGTSDTSFFSPMQSDAFGRLRISEPFTLADSFNRYQDNAQSSYYTAGAGSTSFNSNTASVSLNVNSGATDAAYSETNRIFAYQPGKSLLILQTFVFAAPKVNLTQRAGYFDAANGIYLEQAGSTINLVRRSSTTGSMSETRVSQASWNVNSLPSLDLTKSQIFWMDIEWLGVGSVRCGFVIDGVLVHCHTFHHANITSGVYMTTSCLPIRKEIFNTGVTSSASTMQSICYSVISEGGYTLSGRAGTAAHELGSAVALPNDLSFKPIMSIRLKSSRLGAIVLPNIINVTPVNQAVYKYQIYTQAVTTGGTWTSAGADSSVEYNLAPTSVSSGNVASTGFINASNQTAGAEVGTPLPFAYQLERNIFTPTAYELVIAVASSTNSTVCYGAINWQEIT